jgi:cation-transporting ATPase E
MATLVLTLVGLWILGELTRPFNWWKAALVASMVLALLIVLEVPQLREFFALDLPSWSIVVEDVGIAAVAMLLLEVIWRFTGWREHVRSAGDAATGQQPPS